MQIPKYSLAWNGHLSLSEYYHVACFWAIMLTQMLCLPWYVCVDYLAKLNRKQIARQHSWSTLLKLSTLLASSPHNIWLLFPILCAHVGCSFLGGGALEPPHLGMGHGWPSKNMFVLQQCYRAKFGHSRPEKNLTFASRLLRSLKAFGSDTDRSATYDFLLANPSMTIIVPFPT